MKLKKKIAAVCSVTGTILLVLVILLCLPVTVPRIFGYEIYTVISGSMEPEIPVGSLVYVHAVNPGDVEEGDVIAFYNSVGAGAIITHRVVENRKVSGEFITKGDANEENDMLPVDYGALIGRVAKSVPKLGLVMETLTTDAGKAAAASMIFLFLLLNVAAGLLRREPGKRKRE